MKYLSRIIAVLCVAFMGQYLLAQPPARKGTKKAEDKKENGVSLSPRAKSQYPTKTTPEEVVWKRDIYRSIDLNKEKNAALYYPVEPLGNSINLFTCIFRLIISNQISAYEYSLDGYEMLTPENKIEVKDMLTNYHIYYEEKDGNIEVQSSDVPSNEVLSYYIKESYYFDQKTSTYNQRVTAICPVLHRSGDFGVEVTKYPMFWLNYDEISPYLGQTPVMTSSYNNIQTMSLDDFFAKHQYEGEIYKTVNLRNLTLNQYCPTDSAMKQEQQNIEKQLDDFRNNLWGERPAVEDSTAVADNEEEKSTKKKSTKKSTPKNENSSSSSSDSPRVSVRRQRR